MIRNVLLGAAILAALVSITQARTLPRKQFLIGTMGSGAWIELGDGGGMVGPIILRDAGGHILYRMPAGAVIAIGRH